MKKFWVVALAGLLLVELSGCGLFETGGGESRAVSREFYKDGADNVEVQKAMFECGYENPSTGQVKSDNDAVKAAACMEQAGFKTKEKLLTKEGNCAWKPELPACRPGAEIPKRSVQRRLNSRSCQNNRKYATGLPLYFYNPALCEP